jgi:hypothetical protein
MQTIDIAQAIKDNSANVSQNLDPSVLGGLLKLSTMYLKTSNTVHGEGTDANDFVNFQIYRYSKSAENVPDNADGQILTFRSILNAANYPVVQFAVTQSSVLYMRGKWYSNDWSSWKKII